MNKNISFREFLAENVKNNKPVFFDGGMGTMIQKTGVVNYDIPEDLNFYHPEIIKDIHKQYLESGSNVLTANSFGANPLKLTTARYSAEEYISSALKLQQEAIQEFEQSEHKFAKKQHFCSWDIGQIGKLLEPMGTLTFDEAYESFKECAICAEQNGADVAIVETMSDLYEVKACILAIQENTKLPVVATMTFQDNFRTLTGADVGTCVTYLESLGVDVLGFNCGGSLQEDEHLAQEFVKYASIPVLAQPNAGLPVVENGKAVFKVLPKEFAETQKRIFEQGISILGGCCGTTPNHIGAIVEQIGSLTQTNPITYKTETFICSYNHKVQVGGVEGAKIVGERINPTGKKKCKEALYAQNMQFVLDEAESQINAGAHILDVNVGLPGIDECETMRNAVKTLQATYNTPLQLDSSDEKTLEKNLRYYNGKALVNSVNGKQEIMDKIFPLVKHYGGSVVALCLDEDGISPTAEGRIKVAHKIINEAAKYGIKVKDIFIDALTLTVSSEQSGAVETLKTIKALKEEYGSQGLQFILGVSNISFGLPRRDIINSRFFQLALDAGLSACIINPSSKSMMDSYYAYRTFNLYDKNCLDYIEKYTDTTDPYLQKPTIVTQEAKVESVENQLPKIEYTTEEQNLITIIEKGFKTKAGEATQILLQDHECVEIIDKCIVTALDNVGRDFEKGKKFLPQLLLSAETVSEAFETIKAELKKSGQETESKGTVVLATVYGDIHDIGKNIVKAMLENYGFTVIDLGKNVPIETVVETVLQNDIQLVGLSALMTTTVQNMEQTIVALHKALKEQNKTCTICVGGAVLTPEYADKIGADYYSKDAMETVRIAQKVFSK